MLLLAYNIEKAFDALRLCFVMDPDTKAIVLKLLDPAIVDEPIFDGSAETIGSCAGRKLQIPKPSQLSLLPECCRIMLW
jgi:hypothetical protein